MLHDIQQKLLQVAKSRNLGELSLREIGALIGERSPQKIKHHLLQLEEKGLMHIDKLKGVVARTEPGWATGLLESARLLQIPIVGAANAGPATLVAESNIEGYLKISSTLLKRRTPDTFFALRVEGSSMNKAVVDGKRIEDGDYVIVDASYRTPKDGDIVLSVIDGYANIKRFYRDSENDQIVLMSESTKRIPPIHISMRDSFRVEGKVVQVIKKPKLRI